MKKRSPNLANEKAKKQTLIYCQYQALRAEHKKKQLSAAGKLWEDEDVVHCKMDQYGWETENPVVAEKEDDVRIFEHGQNSGSPRRLPRMVVLFWRHV